MPGLISIATHCVHDLLFSTSSSICDFSVVFILFHFIYNSHSNCSECCVIVALICLCLVANDNGPFFFIYLVGVFIASFKKYLLRLFCPFLIGYLMLLLIHFSVLCVFWVLTVCKTNGRQISSRTLLAVSACLFPVLFKSPIVFDLAHFFKSCFCSLGCEGHKQIISVGIVSWSVSLMFYSGSFRSSRVILGL